MVLKIDFQKHNEEVVMVMDAYAKRKPLRVPVILSFNSRIWILNPDLNREGITFQKFLSDPEIMFQTVLKFMYYSAHNIVHDVEMGIPSKQWIIGPYHANVFDSAYFGAEVETRDGQVPATLPILAGDRKNLIFDKGIPDSFGGFMGKIRNDYEYFLNRVKNFEFHGKPVQVVPPSPLGFDGPLTVATDLRGIELFTDIYEDPEYVEKLLCFITDAVIKRVKDWRKYINPSTGEEKPQSGWLADDSIQLISEEMYKSLVLPFHKKWFNEMYGEGPHFMHLCGNVQRYLPFISKELNVKSFDTGFPIDFSKLRKDIGPDVEIFGGVKVDTLLRDTPENVEKTAKEILQSGIMDGGRFILKEANNLAPCTPLENIQALYNAAKNYRKYRGDLNL